MATQTAAAKLASQMMLTHSTPSYTFSFTPFLQQTYQHSLPADRPICKTYASGGNCPNGTRCLERHVAPPPVHSSIPGQNEAAAAAAAHRAAGGGRDGGGGGGGGGPAFNSLVCKHWLRGLCKKGDGCEFLHEFNLRKMPECNFYIRHNYCQNGEECLYLHIDPMSKLPPCPHYDQGFCPLGPRCSKRHVRRTLCPYYLCGFCPEGRRCKEGSHPKWNPDLEKPVARAEHQLGAATGVGGEDEAGGGYRRGDHLDYDDDDRGDRDGGRGDRDRDRDRDRKRPYDRMGGGQRDKYGGGQGGGRWRGRGGGHKFRGRNH